METVGAAVEGHLELVNYLINFSWWLQILGGTLESNLSPQVSDDEA